MSLHPDIIDAMVAAGASAGMDPGAVLAMVQAACRAAWNVAQQATPPPPVAPAPRETPRNIAEEMRGIAAAMRAIDGDVQRDATDATLHATVQRSSTSRPQTPTERSRKHRAAKAMQRANVSTALHSVASVAPLFPIGLDPKKEARDVASAGAHPLPEGWQPSAGQRFAAVQKLGEIGVGNLIAKFCNHFHARGDELRTAAGWQGRFKNWVLSEHSAGITPQLPLMRKVEAPPDDKWEALRREVHVARRESG